MNSKPSSKIISTLHQETIGGPIDDKSGNQNSCATVPLAGENACSDLHQCTMFVFPYLCVNTIYTLAPIYKGRRKWRVFCTAVLFLDTEGESWLGGSGTAPLKSLRQILTCNTHHLVHCYCIYLRNNVAL